MSMCESLPRWLFVLLCASRATAAITMARKKGSSLAIAAKPTGKHLQLLEEIWRDKGVLLRHLQDHNIDEHDANGESLLHVACADTKSLVGSSDTLVKQLVQAGADCNLATTSTGYTPLMLARTAEVASCLLDNGADIDRECNKGSTALYLACSGGHLAVAKVLLKRGAEQHILKASMNGTNPLSAALVFKKVDIAMLLLEHLLAQADFDINHPTLVVDQPLICTAAWFGLRRVVAAALDHGAFINAAGPNGTALVLAAQEGHRDTVSLLCERGADVSLRCSRLQRNSIEAALAGGHVHIIKKLIKHGADINAVCPTSGTAAVVQAAVLGQCAVLQVLLQAGARVDAALQYKSLSCAIWHLDDAAAAEVVKSLLPYCSSLDEPNAADDHTALTYALSRGKLKAARALHAGGADVHFKLQRRGVEHIAAQSGSVAVLKWVQSVGVNLRTPNSAGSTPLHCACCSGKPDAVKYLLDLPGGADDVNARTTRQQTPLYFAAASGADSVVELLLQRGAAMNVRCSAGTIPLMHAKTTAVAKLLLAAGADATAAGAGGLTVLHYYATSGASAGAVCLVLKAGADPTAVDGDGSTAAHLAGIKGHFALEALLSRATDDYLKKQTLATNSNSSSSSSAGNSSTTMATVSAESNTASSGNSSTADASVDDDQSAYTQQAEASHDTTATEQQQPKRCKAKQPCANCSKLTTKRCKRCAVVYYCSAECQKVCFKDTEHRAQCEATAAAIV
jgi:uncharacterized protein